MILSDFNIETIGIAGTGTLPDTFAKLNAKGKLDGIAFGSAVLADRRYRPSPGLAQHAAAIHDNRSSEVHA